MLKVRLKDRGEFEIMMLRRAITRKELAELCSVHYSTIAYYVNGQRNPRIEAATLIANRLGVSFDVLFELVPRKKTKSRFYHNRNDE